MSSNESTSQDKSKCLSCENCKCSKDEYLTNMQLDGKDSFLKRNESECNFDTFASSVANGTLSNYTWTITKIDHGKRENRVYKCIQDPDLFIKWKLIERIKWQD
jgi:hypothetical protein